MPISITILTTFVVGSFSYLIVPRLSPLLRVISMAVVSLFLILFLYSYYSAAFSDPGFLPFNWIDTQRFWYSWQDQLSGMATTEAQMDFARAAENRPPGSSFSRTSGRFVMRADHICGWVANWVGKRNHKQFLLMNFYGTLLSGSLLLSMFAPDVRFGELPDWKQGWAIAIGLVEALFVMLLGGMFYQTMNDLATNRTRIQRMRQERGLSYSCEESMREVCGDGSVLGWVCPFHAFDENLVLRQDPDRDRDAIDQ
jgi:hypothetical protein